jgi:hypothetical protein
MSMRHQVTSLYAALSHLQVSHRSYLVIGQRGIALVLEGAEGVVPPVDVRAGEPPLRGLIPAHPWQDTRQHHGEEEAGRKVSCWLHGGRQGVIRHIGIVRVSLLSTTLPIFYRYNWQDREWTGVEKPNLLRARDSPRYCDERERGFLPEVFWTTGL